MTLDAPAEGGTKAGPVRVKLSVGDVAVAGVELRWPGLPQVNVPLEGVDADMCRVDVLSPPNEGFVDEISVRVHAGTVHDKVIERHLHYSHDGRATTGAFPLPDGHLSVAVSIAELPSDQVGIPLKVMAFNIWHGGRLDGPSHGLVTRNVEQLVEFIRLEDPDLVFVVETYGTGPAIEQALNLMQPAGRRFHGVQVTRQPERPPDKDNLWLFTWLPIAETYPTVTTGVLTSFNFGGARLVLPDGTDLHAFSVWLRHLDDPVTPINRSALELALGMDRSVTNDEIVATDMNFRLPMASTLTDRLSAYVPDESAAVILGGDFNTLSHLDWSLDHATDPGHEGLVLDWPAMREFDEAGFTDTYRFANPDAARFPGGTKTGLARFHAPTRIDYILTRGEGVRILSSSRRISRLPQHRGGSLSEFYPFYSDHAAVVTDLVVRGTGRWPAAGVRFGHDMPEPPPRDVPPPPDGAAVPRADVTITASRTDPGSDVVYAIDGNPQTTWRADGPLGSPGRETHTVTLDLGRTRMLRGIRYQPPLDTIWGIITRYSLWTSTNGEDFVPMTSGAWESDQLPKDIHLEDVPARHVRLVSQASVGGCSSIAELTVFEAIQVS